MTDSNGGWLSRIRNRLSRLKTKRTQDLTSVDKRLVLGLSGRRLPSWRQMKHLPRFLSDRDRLTVYGFTAVIVIGLASLVAMAYRQHVQVVPADGGAYTEAAVGAPRFINPVLASTNDADNDLNALIFSGLMRYDGQGQLVPDLAESYEVSDEGRTYTFYLKRLVEWHDGTAFTAGDVAATFSFIKNPAWKSPYQSRFKNVGVETPNDHTVVFRLQEAHAPFLSMLTGILPAHLWEEVLPENAARAELNIKPVGTGPYKFKSLTKDRKGTVKSLTLSANDRYYGQRPHLDTVTFKYYFDYDTAANDLLKKRVDGVAFLPAEAEESLDKLRTVRDYRLRLPQYTAVFFNPVNDPPLKSVSVRQALTLALDRKSVLRDALGGEGLPVHGPIPPGLTGFYPGIKQYGYDLAKAAQLLTEDGWELNGSGQREKTTTVDGQTSSQFLQVVLTTVDAKDNLAVAQMIKNGWEKIGVKVDLDVVSAGRIQLERIRPREYEALLYGEVIGGDADPFPFWHSSQRTAPGLNLAAFNNRRADELLEQGRRTTDPTERAARYQEFQDVLTEDLPAIFLYSPTYSYMINRDIMGVRGGLVMTPSGRFADIANWYRETRRVWE